MVAGRRAQGRRQGPGEPPAPVRFVDSTAFKLIPILLSAIALLLSTWTLYYKDLSHRPRLVVTVADLAMPTTYSVAYDPEGYTRGAVRARLLLANGGNRPANLVGASVEILARPRGTGPDAAACRAEPDPATLRFPVEGGALPATVAPGALVAVPVAVDILYDWRRLRGNRAIESCIAFEALDDRGKLHHARFPLSSYVMRDADRDGRVPAFTSPPAAFHLL